jgi:hypothetical protein
VGVPSLSVPRHVLERRDERSVGDSGKFFIIMILQPVQALWHDEAILKELILDAKHYSFLE